MRLLLDTNIVIFYTTGNDSSLSRDVMALLKDYDNQLYTSAETLRELIVAYRNKGIGNSLWKNESDMLKCIKEEYFIEVLPVTEHLMETYATLTINEAQGHKDPSDHVIISHALSEKLTLVSSDTRFPFYRDQGLDLIMNER